VREQGCRAELQGRSEAARPAIAALYRNAHCHLQALWRKIEIKNAFSGFPLVHVIIAQAWANFKHSRAGAKQDIAYRSSSSEGCSAKGP
jgi:hypothetical protein